MVSTIVMGAFFCYGMFTLQRKSFLLDWLPSLWKLFPKKLHEPLFECGICVTSIWGIFFIVAQHLIPEFIPSKYIWLANIPFYIISMCGICAILDRAVKFFEYGYNYKKVRDIDTAKKEETLK